MSDDNNTSAPAEPRNLASDSSQSASHVGDGDTGTAGVSRDDPKEQVKPKPSQLRDNKLPTSDEVEQDTKAKWASNSAIHPQSATVELKKKDEVAASKDDQSDAPDTSARSGQSGNTFSSLEQWSCALCKKSFGTSHGLAIHRGKMHTNELRHVHPDASDLAVTPVTAESSMDAGDIVSRRSAVPRPTPIRIETLIFFDLEFTGLPPMEHDVTEISMVAVSRDHFLSEMESTAMPSLPRVLYKLTLPVRPEREITAKAAELTGLSFENVCCAPLLKPTVVKAVSSFLECLKPPLCLVAHNGKRCDYKLFLRDFGNDLTMELMRRLYCADSIDLFKNLDKQNESTQNGYSLGVVYQRLFGKEPVNVHGAEVDAETIIKCSMHYGEPFVTMCDQMAVLLTSLGPK